MRECRLWSTIPCWVLKRSSSIRTGCPNHAIQRHIAITPSSSRPPAWRADARDDPIRRDPTRHPDQMIRRRCAAAMEPCPTRSCRDPVPTRRRCARRPCRHGRGGSRGPSPRVAVRGSKPHPVSRTLNCSSSPVAVELHRHGGAAAAVLGRVLDRLQAAQVHRPLDVRLAQSDVAGHDRHGDRAVPSLDAEGGGHSVRGQHRRRDTVRDAPQVVADGPGLVDQFPERLGELRRRIPGPFLCQRSA